MNWYKVSEITVDFIDDKSYGLVWSGGLGRKIHVGSIEKIKCTSRNKSRNKFISHKKIQTSCLCKRCFKDLLEIIVVKNS